MKDSTAYRALALDALRGNWKTAILTGLAASALGAGIVNGFGNFSSHAQQSDTNPSEYFSLFSQEPGGALLAVVVVCTLAWLIFTFIVCGAARLGYAQFNLHLADHIDARFADLFSQKDRLWTGFCMNFLQGLYVALWSLLLVVPGVVKSYSYAMTPYILAEYPSLTANEAITESRRIMDGHKWQLFCLDLSFLGWELLCILPMVLVYFFFLPAFVETPALGVAYVLLLSVPLGAGFFFLHPYEEAAWAIFYRDITTSTF